MNNSMNQLRGVRYASALLVCLILSWQSAIAAAVTVPYSDNFQTSTVGTTPANWNAAGATWEIANNGTANVYQATQSAASAFYSDLQFSDLGSATTPKNFSMSTSFVITDPTSFAGNEYVGFAALATTAGLGSYYLADVQGSGAIRLITLGGTNSDYSTSGSASLGTNLMTGVTYTLTLQGIYTGSTLNMTFTVSDATHTASVTGTDATPWTTASGSYFGYRLNNSAPAGDTLQVQFDNFSMVPEPSALAMLALGGVLILAGKRRLNQV